MKTQKIKPVLCIELLRTFSKKEIENLSHLVSCRYFNTDRYVVDLLKVLSKYNLKNISLDNEFQCTLYESIFPHLPKPTGKLSKNEGSQLNRKMNALLRLTEQFLMIQSLEEDTVVNNELLYPQLIERQQSLLFNRHINKVQKMLNCQLVNGMDYHEQQYKLENHIINYQDSMNKSPSLENLASLEQHLDVYYLLYKLEIHLAVLSVLRVSSKKEYDFSSMIATETLLELAQYAHHPLITVYKVNINLEKEKADKAYFHLLELLNKYENEIDSNRLRSFYTNATNYCIGQIRTGNQAYSQHLFKLYKTMHHKDLLIDNGVVSIQILKNIIIMACREKAFEWAEMVIQYYKEFIPLSIRKSICQFNYGTIAFHQKQYETAHDKFIQVDKINLSYDINTRILLIKCLYEKEKAYNEYTMTAFRSTEKFFKNNKELPGQHKKAYKNFIQILINLYRVRYKAGKRTLEWVKDKLEQQKVNIDKRWLLEKIKELEKIRR